MKRTLLLIMGLTFLLGACSPGEGIEVRDAWMRPAAQGGNGAVYFVIENHSSETHELIGAASDIAEAVEVHESRMSGDVMEMHQLISVSLGPDAEVVFEPGGLHIMLVGLKEELEVGDEIEATLQFRDFEELMIRVPVQEASANEEHH